MQKLKFHPDLGDDEWNAVIVNEAYNVLSNPESRAAGAYDGCWRDRSNQQRHRARLCPNRLQPCTRGRERRAAARQIDSVRSHDLRDLSSLNQCGNGHARPAAVRYLRTHRNGNTQVCRAVLENFLPRACVW
jgi:curved DNA-binding protein CbpA